MHAKHNRLSPIALLVGALVAVAGCQPPTAPPPKPKTDTKQPAKDDSAAAEAKDQAPAAEVQSDAGSGEAVQIAAVAADSAKKTSPKAKKPNKVMLGDPELTAGIPGSGPVKLAELEDWLADESNHQVLEVELPVGLATGQGQIKGLDKNPLTRAKIELGRQLYFDPRLSADVNVSCASCHDPDEGFTRHTQFGVGIRGQLGGRNSPASYNRILSDSQFWDGRADSLEDQAIGPIANAIEMGNTHDACVTCLGAVKGYRLQFDKIFGKLDIQTVGMAIASFERAIVSGPSPFDYRERFRPFEKLDPDDLKDDDPDLYAKYQEAAADMKAHPMNESAIRGRELFFSDKGSCTACHVGPNLTDEKYHNLGIGMDKENPDLGRAVFSMEDKDKGAFKTPTIRNVELSHPYMHDGSIKTLAEVVEWYAKGGHPNPALDPKIKKLDLNDQDKQDLVEFMKACTGEFPKIERGRLPE